MSQKQEHTFPLAYFSRQRDKFLVRVNLENDLLVAFHLKNPHLPYMNLSSCQHHVQFQLLFFFTVERYAYEPTGPLDTDFYTRQMCGDYFFTPDFLDHSLKITPNEFSQKFELVTTLHNYRIYKDKFASKNNTRLFWFPSKKYKEIIRIHSSLIIG